MGVINRKYPVLTTLDSKLTSALLDVRYAYSPQLGLELQAWDQPIPIIDPSVLYVVAKGGRLDSAWQWSEKVRLRGFALLQQENMVNIASLSSQNRQEQLSRLGLSIDYFLQPHVRVFAQALSEKQWRTPTLPNISQASLQIGLEYTFETIPGAAKNNPLERFQPGF